MMISPAPGRTISSGWGWRRHPVTGRRSLHRGLDFAGQFTVRAAAAGQVVENAFDAAGYGYFLTIEHNPNLRTRYAHAANRPALQIGTSVPARAPLFVSGSTGLSTGNHLHFEVLRRIAGLWVRVNPAPYLLPPTPTPTPLGADPMNTWSIVLHKSGRNQALYLIGEGRIQPITATAAKELGIKRRTVTDAGMDAIRRQLQIGL